MVREGRDMTHTERLKLRGLRVGDYVTCSYRMPNDSQPWIHPAWVGVILQPGSDPKQWNGSNSESTFCDIAGVVKVQYLDENGNPAFSHHDHIDSLRATDKQTTYWIRP